MNEFLTNKSDIVAWLEQYNITDYELIKDDKYGYVVDVDCPVNLFNKKENFILVKFGNVGGNFHCENNKLTNLEFSPHTVNGIFSCENNKLSSLEGCPTTVNGGFYCNNNNLTSLEFSPQTVNGDFYCYNNKLTSLQFCPKTVNGNFLCHNNKLASLQFSPKIIRGNFYCNNNKIADLINFPDHVGGEIYLGMNGLIDVDMNKHYSFAELYPIHLEYKITAEKEILEKYLNKTNKKVSVKIKI